MVMSAGPSTAPVGDGVQLIGGRLLRTYSPLMVLEGHENAVYAVLDIGGGQIVSASLDTTMRVWDVSTGVCLRCLSCNSEGSGHDGGILCLTLMQDGR